MRFGANSFAAIPFSGSDLSEATTPATVDLIADQDAERAYLFHATPYDAVATAETDVRASIGLKWPVVDSAHWPAILKTAVDVQTDLFGEDEDAQGRTSFGNIELLIGDGEHDDIASHYWDGRDVQIFLGQEGLTFAEYVLAMKGTAEDITYTRDRLAIVLRGKEELLDKVIQETTYAGTGGLEGDENLKGNPKPLAFGFVNNISPVLVDQDNLIYQYHDGEVLAVSQVYDGGFALINQGDVADIEATSVLPGYYKTQLDGGYIKLGAVPEKLMTMDLFGDASGDGYVRNASDIIKRLVLDYSDLTGADLNLPSFYTAKLDSSRSNSGIYLSKEKLNDVITDLMFSIGGAWTFNRKGQLTIAVLRTRRSAGTINENDIVKGTFRRDRTKPPSWQRRIGFQKAWTVFTDDQFLGAASSYRRNLATREYRYSANVQSAIKTEHVGARIVVKDTLLSTADDANTENLRQQDIFANETQRITFAARRQHFKYAVGQTVTVEYDRFGINGDAVILGLRENTNTGHTTFRLLLTNG